MSTDYDPIAEQYKRSKEQPWRAFIEAHTLMTRVGDLSGKSVLDVACGEGFYTRLLRRKGAARVTGVDLSPRMIELARAEEIQRPLGIDYMVGDGGDLRFSEPFDMVFAAYLLNYARDREELGRMCESIARCLKPGGRFVSVNCNPAAAFDGAVSYRPYGFDAGLRGPAGEGAPIVWTFHLEDGGALEIENYLLDRSLHDAAFQSAGLKVRWPPPLLSPQGEAAFGRAYWRDFLEHPPIAFIDGVKA